MKRTNVVRLASLVAIVSVGSGALVACGGGDDDVTDTADASRDGSTTHPTPADSGTDASSAGDATLDGATDAAAADAAATDSGDASATDSGDASGDDAGDASDASDAAKLLGKAVFTTHIPGSPDSPPGDVYTFGFVVETPAAPTPTCTVSAAGASCQLSVCTGAAPQPVDLGVSANAGTVTATTLQTGSDAGATKTALYNDAGSYSLVGGPYFSTAGSGTLTLAGSGDEADGGLPAFSLTVPLPGQARTTFPSLTIMSTGVPVGTTTLPRQSDLPITWTNGVAGAQVIVALDTTSPGDAGTITKTLTCTFDQALGSATIPSAGGLQELDAVDGTTGRGGIGVTDFVLGTAADGPATIQATIAMIGMGYNSIVFTTTN